MALGKLGTHVQKNEARFYLTPYTKSAENGLKAHVRPENSKTSGSKCKGRTSRHGLGNEFMDVTPKSQAKYKNKNK